MAVKKKIKPASAISAGRNPGHAISRMPRAVKDAVSNAIEDGADWKAIREICAKAGFHGVRPQNVTNYRKGHHQEWLRKQERLEAIRRDSDTTAAIVEHYVKEGGSPAEAGLLAASEIMAQALNGLGPETMQILIADDPKALFSITRELARVAKLLTAKQVIAHNVEAASPEEVAGPELSEEEQNAKVVAMVDAALGLKRK